MKSLRLISLYDRVLLLALTVLGLGTSAHAAEWPQWRGPNRNAVSPETGLFTGWAGGAPALAWQASGLGDGYSSVVVTDRFVFTTGRAGDDVVCFALEAESGRAVWATKIGETTRNVMSTPSVDEELLFALDPDGELTCLDRSEGTIVWQRSFVDDFDGRLMSGRGYGESPLIDGDRLICTPGGQDAMVVALDRRTGQVIWKSSTPEIGENGSDGAAFSSIVISEAAGVRQYIQMTGRGLIGIESDTGRFLWGYNDISNGTANIPTPVVSGDLVFSANGYNAGSVLLRIEPTNGGTGVAAREAYRLPGNRFQNHHGGFVLIDDHIYGGHGSNNGLPTCLALQTGEIVWKRRGPGTGSAAVVAADGRLFFRYQDGVVAMIEATPAEYRLQGTFEIPGAGGDSWSHPVIADGKLFLREKNNLWAYRLRNPGHRTRPEGVPAMLPPELAALNRQGAAVQQLGTEELKGMPLRLYRFALNPTEKPQLLSHVKLTDRHLTEEGALDPDIFSLLEQLNAPVVLSLAGSRIDEEGLRQVSTLESLVGLNLELCGQLGDNAFDPLSGAKRLATLLVAGTSFSERSLQAVINLQNLAALDLEVCDGVTDAACVVIGRMQQLRALNLKKTGFEPVKLTNEGLSHLSGLTQLEVLNLSGNSVTDDGLRHLQPLSLLRELDLSRLPLTDAGLTTLASLKKLEDLNLLFSEGFAGPIVTDAGMTSLANLGALKRLNLVGASITDRSLDDLSQMRTLRRLTLIDTQISEQGILQLRRLLPECQILSPGSTAKH